MCSHTHREGISRTVRLYRRAGRKNPRRLCRSIASRKPRVLFSAHGLPDRIALTDPYPGQCRRTADALTRALALPGLDAVLCYQSRVGPLPWIKPATDDEIRHAGRDKTPVVIAPIAFVSEHSETLVEIDIDYRALAAHSGVPFFASTGTVSTAPEFIEGLAQLDNHARKVKNG